MMEIHEWKYLDPERENPGRKGMLLSNDIEKFCDKGLLIAREFKTENLRPAAYTLRIGSKFVDSRGRPGLLDEKKKSYFTMEPNSIVYVSAHEELNLPFYIAARFNLRVKWVYKGILLGTGPQVEPGYRGFLSCPLYNLTDHPIRIEYLQDFATIDFERTSDFCPNATLKQIQQAIKSGDEFDSVEWQEQTYMLFKQKEYKQLKLLPEYDVISSLFELSQEVRTWRHIGIGFAVSFFALTLALLSFGTNVYRQVNDLTNQVGQIRVDFRGAQAEANELKERLAALGNPAPPQQPPPKQLPPGGK